MSGHIRTEQFGGSRGTPFRDDLTEIRQITEVFVRHGGSVDAIWATWGTTANRQLTGEQHGGGGGKLSSFQLGPDEYISGVDVLHGGHVDQLTFYTTAGTTHGPYGDPGGEKSELRGLKVSAKRPSEPRGVDSR